MTDPEARPSLLEDLDRRQDEVLQQLDELNARTEALIREFTSGRTTDSLLPTV